MMTQLAQKRIVCAACKLDETIVLGSRHFDRTMHNTIDLVMEDGKPRNWCSAEQGFIDQYGNFHDRVAALAIATAAEQINVVRPKTRPANELFSEDLY